MTSFLLMRHAEPDYSGPTSWNTIGWGFEMAPLTTQGEQQTAQQINRILEFNPEVVLCSPATRALQTALTLRSRLKAPFKVEFELHEWVPDLEFRWRTSQDVQELKSDSDRHNGEWPLGETRPWETRSSMRLRALEVLKRYAGCRRVLAVCHHDLIESVTGISGVGFAGLVPFNLEE